MSTVRQIAEHTGLSAATVSRALNSHPDVNEQTRARVFRAANRAGYGRMASKTRPACCSIAFALVGDFYFMSEYDAELLIGIRRGLNESKLDVTLIDVLRDKLPEETYTQFFQRRGVQGAIVRTDGRFRRVCEEIAAEGFPLVVVAERFEGGESSPAYVVCDSRPSSQQATEHLIEMGHRRIALITVDAPDADHLDREAGFRAALSDAGIQPDPRLRLAVTPELKSGAAAVNQLLSLAQPPTAIFAANPHPSLGALRRLHELNVKVPDELSFVGFDDNGSRHRVFPTFTAVCQDTQKVGYESALWLMNRIDDRASESLQHVLSASFEVNRSTGIAPTEAVRILPNGTRVNPTPSPDPA